MATLFSLSRDLNFNNGNFNNLNVTNLNVTNIITPSGTPITGDVYNGTTTAAAMSFGSNLLTGTVTVGGASELGLVRVGASGAVAGNTELQAGTTGAIAIGGNLTTGTIDIGGVTETGTITVGKSTSGQTINIGTAVGPQNITIGAAQSNTSVTLVGGDGAPGVVRAVTLFRAQANPAFFAYQPAGVIGIATGDGTLYTLGTTALTIDFDRQINLATANVSTAGVFTAPVAGIYYLSAKVVLSGIPVSVGVSNFNLFITTTGPLSYANSISYDAAGVSGPVQTLSVNTLVNLAAGNTAIVTLTANGFGAASISLTGGKGNSYFTGYFIG